MTLPGGMVVCCRERLMGDGNWGPIPNACSTIVLWPIGHWMSAMTMPFPISLSPPFLGAEPVAEAGGEAEAEALINSVSTFGPICSDGGCGRASQPPSPASSWPGRGNLVFKRLFCRGALGPPQSYTHKMNAHETTRRKWRHYEYLVMAAIRRIDSHDLIY